MRLRDDMAATVLNKHRPNEDVVSPLVRQASSILLVTLLQNISVRTMLLVSWS